MNSSGKCSYRMVNRLCIIHAIYVLFQECSKKQKNDETQSTSVDALSSDDGSEEVMFLLRSVLDSIFFCFVHPKGDFRRQLSTTKYNNKAVIQV